MTVKQCSVFVLGLCTACCAHSQKVEDGAQLMINAAQCEAMATAFEQHHDYFQAAIYYDAALSAGGDELSLLPRLIAAQIRSGRLTAAEKNIKRLIALEPDWKGAIELAALLGQFTGSERGTEKQEDLE